MLALAGSARRSAARPNHDVCVTSRCGGNVMPMIGGQAINERMEQILLDTPPCSVNKWTDARCTVSLRSQSPRKILIGDDFCESA
jgi:hypothetical protein